MGSNTGMADQLLTVSMFVSAGEAEAARGRLQAEGIEAQTVSQSQPDGAVRIAVQVAETDFGRAMGVLFPLPGRQARAALSKTVAMPPPWTCSGCGAEVMGISDACWSCGRARAVPSPAEAPAGEPPRVVSPAIEREPAVPEAARELVAEVESAAKEAPAPAAEDLPPPAPIETATPSLRETRAAPDAAASVAPSAADTSAAAPRPRFAAAPPPWMAAAPRAPAPEPPKPSAVPRFAKLRSVASETKESGQQLAAEAVEATPAPAVSTKATAPASADESRAPSPPEVEAAAVAADVAPQPATSAEPAAATSEPTAPLQPELLDIPLTIEPETLRRRDRQAESLAREAESMALRAWWASVVALVLWPVYIYSFWLLLTLSFARVPLSRRGRWCFWGGWAVSVLATTAIFLLVKSRE